MLRRLHDWLALTATERKVLLFVTGAFVAGLGVRLYQETFPPAKVFDYTSTDSTFAMLSAGEASSDLPEVARGPLDINRATKQQLMALPGIGAVTAERIIAHRTEHGPFGSIEDLRKIRGISGRKLEQLRPLITVY
ncbi:MAG: hypothetical protein HBSIN02_01330 [Bacteroidia bacterium]|nr:MAG: hypothetical protein HBSIN02_01330 [Bacteroidia bacterium]